MLKEYTDSFSTMVNKAKLTRVDHLWAALHSRDYGPKRRAKIMQYIEERGFQVNRKYCPQMKEDPDLRLLVEQGLLKRKRVVGGKRQKQIYLIPA